MIGDFIKDESGIWWLVNIRGYKFDYPKLKELPINIKPITHFGEEEH